MMGDLPWIGSRDSGLAHVPTGAWDPQTPTREPLIESKRQRTVLGLGQ